MSLLETRGLQFGYGDKKVLENVNLSVAKGSIYGFLGKNGAGKSTTIKLLLGLEHPTMGTIHFDGRSFQKDKLKNHAVTGSLIEAPSIYAHLTAFENLKYLDFIFKLGNDRIHEVLEMVKLKGHECKRVRNFSMGMKQRLGIAMSIFPNPSLLILDEPFNGLDPEGVYEMRELMLDLQKEGKTIFFSSHILSDIQKICTHIGILDKGKVIFQGLKSDLLSSVSRAVVIKTSDNESAKRLCSDNGLAAQETTENSLSVNVKDDYSFSKLINLLVKADIKIFSVQNIEVNLEDIFLKFTTTEQHA